MDEHHQGAEGIHDQAPTGKWVTPFDRNYPDRIIEWKDDKRKIVFNTEQRLPMFVSFQVFVAKDRIAFEDYVWHMVFPHATIRIATLEEWYRFCDNPIPFVTESVLGI